MKSVLDKGEYVCCLFMDPSEAFAIVNHDLLLAKLKVYGFSGKFLALMCSYLKSRKQIKQIDKYLSSGKRSIDHYYLIYL